VKGIVPSLNTPFLEDGSVDHVSLRRLVNHTVEAGCGGMLGLAVAGEHSTLTLEEKCRFIETVTDANAQRIPFVVSVTADELSGSVELGARARLAPPTPI
jgi:4-hydroxy-tetrahydrodipicolinate synthase